MASSLVAFAAHRIGLRPGRSALLATSIFALTFVAASVLLFQQALERTADRVLRAGPSLVVSRVHAGGWTAVPVDEALRIEAVRGVTHARPRVWGVLPGPPAVTVVGSAELADASAEAIAGSGVAPSAGGLLALRGLDGAVVSVRVRETLSREADLTAFDTVLVPLPVARRLLMIEPGLATDIAVESVRAEEDDALAADIAAGAAGPLRVVTRSQLRGAYTAQLGQRGGLTSIALIPAALALALLIAGLASGGEGARRDVGKLKLLGWTTSQVALLHLTEVALAALAGTAMGLAAAYAQLFLLGGGAVMSLVLGWGTRAPTLWLDPQGAALALLQVGALVLTPCAVAAIIPAWRLAHTDPLELIEAP